jgi:hypothetical protein
MVWQQPFTMSIFVGVNHRFHYNNCDLGDHYAGANIYLSLDHLADVPNRRPGLAED